MCGRHAQWVTPIQPFTIAVLPDTQQDLWNATHITNNFNGRLSWLVDNQDNLNLKYMVQVGDLQDTDNLIFSSDTSVNPRYISGWPIDHYQYYHASEGLEILENAGIPYQLCVGNHDTGAVCGGPACPVVAGQTQSTPIEVRNTSTWNTYYPQSRFPDMTFYETGKTDNSYRTFTAGGLKWLVLSLELWPRTDVINWAKTVAASHLDHNIILLTHSYINGSAGIEQTNGGYGANSPQYMYDNLVKVYPNFRFVFCGHVDNSAYHVDTGTNGNKIHSLLNCYHDSTNNWIRLLRFDIVQNRVTSKVYSPLTDIYRTDSGDTVTIPNISWVK